MAMAYQKAMQRPVFGFSVCLSVCLREGMFGTQTNYKQTQTHKQTLMGVIVSGGQ
jgi:hypothetical protein